MKLIYLIHFDSLNMIVHGKSQINELPMDTKQRSKLHICVENEREREREHYSHVLVYMQYVAQIMGIHVHQAVENINIWGDLLLE